MLDNEDFAYGRRRSVDVGGLALALENQGLGHGWGSWDRVPRGGTRYAELLYEMCTQTHTAVTHCDTDQSPIEIPPETRNRLIRGLDRWDFEPHKLPDEEVLFCAQILFESLFQIENMHIDTGVSLNDISTFLKHLRRLYCGQNSYHNFQHALDVLQACQAFLCAAAVVPPVSALCHDVHPWRPNKRKGRLVSFLENIDLFALFIAAIGHDVGHPGFTNMFMKNADAPLSAVFDGKSALEHMHYALLIEVMRHHGLGSLLDRPNGQAFRKMLAGIVLATDMGVHLDFMKNFDPLVAGKDFPLPYRKLLLCQALIKCADISNPSRPPGVSHYWADALMAEWSCQASLERLWQLPPSVQPSETPLAQVRGQIFFISKFSKPLLDITARVIPEMQEFADRCTSNLAMWKARCVELTSTIEVPPPSPKTTAPGRSPADFLTSFPLTLPTFVRSCQDDPQGGGEWHTYPPSSPSSSASSDVMPDNLLGDRPSPPASPSLSIGSALFVLAPRSSSSSLRTNCTTSEATTAMRAAYRAGIRKKRSFHSRLSWTADLSPVSSMTNLAASASAAAYPRAIATHAAHVGTHDTLCTATVGVVVPAPLEGRERCTVGSVQ